MKRINQVLKEYIRKRLFFLVVISCVLGAGSSLVYGCFEYIKGGDTKGVESIEEDNINEVYGINKNDNVYYIDRDGGKLELKFENGMYINKLQYTYTTEKSLENDSQIHVFAKNAYGEYDESILQDNYINGTHKSIVNIKGYVERIILEFPSTDNDFYLEDFVVDNSFKWNPLLAVLISLSSFIVLFLIAFRNENSKNIGFATFVCIMTLGTCLLLLQPPYCTGWDEEIHFENSYDLAITRDTNGAPNSIHYLIDNYVWLDRHQINSFEERSDFIKNLNDLANTTNGQGVNDYGMRLTSIGYVFQAGALTVGRFLNMPFYVIWIMGKFANLLLYAIGMGIAVWIVPVCKRLLAVMGILPTMLFISTTYAYDVTVNVFIIIGMGIWLREILDKNNIFEVKWRIIFLGCMLIGSMPKAIYAPLVLCALFLPSKKFKSKKDQIRFKSLIILAFFGLMSTFVLPVLIKPSQGGDVRGGSTSIATQLSYVLGQPIAYAKVLIGNIRSTLLPYIMEDAITSMAYMGRAVQSMLYVIFLPLVWITDNYCDEAYKNKKIQVVDRIYALAFIIITTLLIWTALYLSFTEVGETIIAGVQGRYYLPFMFLLFLCIRPSRIKSEYKVENYQMIVMLIASILMISQLYFVFYQATAM